MVDKSESNVEIRIRNVITTADLNQKVDATKFVNYQWGTYDFESYGGRCGYIKDETMKGRVTVFLSGKMISTGATSVRDSIKQLETSLGKLIQSRLIRNVKISPRVQNILSTVNMGHPIDITTIAVKIPNVTYEPDQFPAAILRMMGSPVCLLFSSGKIVVTGSKSESIMTNAINKLQKILKPFYIR